ncbi:hypothetical protein ACIQXV_17165 [Neobacillus sp. NPDC097160]|uniref:hypothetical protein n=1 Tax=Neobacillus sp. NPDC097160 TaxID=3364298 RepID=UPI00380CA26E
MKTLRGNYLIILLIVFVTASSVFHVPNVHAGSEGGKIEDLVNEKKLNWTNFDQFAKGLEENQKFYAIHLNGNLNYPSLISPNISPMEIVELAQDTKRATLSKEELQKEYSKVFDNYFCYYVEDSNGNTYLLILDQLVKVKVATNSKDFLLTVDSNHYKDFKNNGYVELKKGQTYKFKIEKQGYKSFEKMVDLRGNKSSYTLKADLKSTTNWTIYIVVILGIAGGIGICIWFFYKRRRDEQRRKQREQESIPIRKPLEGTKTQKSGKPILGTSPLKPNPNDDSYEVISEIYGELPLLKPVTIAGVILDHSIIDDESKAAYIIQALNRKIKMPITKIDSLLREMKEIIITEKSRNDNSEITGFLRKIHSMEEDCKINKGNLELDIDRLRALKRTLEPIKEFNYTIQPILDSYNSLLVLYFKVCDLSNEVLSYKYKENKRLGNEEREINGTHNQEAMEMIKNTVMPMINTLMGQMQDVQSNLGHFSVLIDNMEKYIENVVLSRIKVLESNQEQSIQEILQIREDIVKLPEEIQKDIEKKLLLSKSELNEEFNQQMEALKMEMEDKIQTINHSVLSKLDQLNNHNQQYQDIALMIKKRIPVKCPPVIINSLTLGRYLFHYQREIFKNDASVIYLAYCKALENIFNPKSDKNFNFAAFLSDHPMLTRHFKDVDFQRIRENRNNAAHTKKVSLVEVERIDQELLEQKTNNDVLIVRLIKHFF